MDTMGKYIYGVIDHGVAETFPLDGVVQFDADTDETPDWEQAYTISWQDISAVVTDAPIVDYTALPKDSLARLLVRHQQVIEKVMARHAILPLRLGTSAAGDEQVRCILARGYRTIKDTLQKTRGLVEVDVTATINDFGAFLLRISQVAEIRQLMQSFLRTQQGVTTEAQMKVGLLVKQYADKEKLWMSQQIQAPLNDLAEDFRAHDLMDDKMVLNSAFLIRKELQGDFDDQVRRLNARFGDGLDFRCVGPLPPYSFHTLEVRAAPFEEVDWARRQLGLSDEDFITADAIKKAHRRVALTCHPDKHPDMPDIEKKFHDMSRAYKILLDCCRASSQAEPEEGFHLHELACEKNAILVTTLG
jgi:hypothetical protein